MFHILLGAWWEVDLGSNFEVASVEVTNRQDCCGYRLRNSDVVLKLDDDTPFATFHIATAFDGEVFDIPASSFVSNLLTTDTVSNHTTQGRAGLTGEAVFP